MELDKIPMETSIETSIKQMIKLFMVDKQNEVKMTIDKNILDSNLEYFQKMFHFDTDSKQNEIVLQVDNALVAAQLFIPLIYPSWYVTLKKIQTQCFFCQQTSPQELYDLDVPVDGLTNEGFELLLQLVEELRLFGDHRILKLIRKSIPKNYPMEKLTKEFVKQLLNLNGHLVVSTDANVLNFWNMNGCLVDSVKIGEKSKWCLAVMNDSWILCNDRSYIYIWDFRKRKTVGIFNGHRISVNDIAVSKNNEFVVSAEAYHASKVLVWKPNEIFKDNSEDIPYSDEAIIMSRHTEARTVAISNDNKWMVSGGNNQKIEVWDLTSEMLVRTLNHTHCIIQVAITNDCKFIVSIGDNGRGNVWDLQTGEMSKSFGTETDDFNRVVVANNNNWMVTGGEDGVVKIWDTSSFELMKTLNGHTKYISSLAISRNDRMIVSCSDEINIWDATDGRLLQTIPLSSYVSYVAITDPNYDNIDQKMIDYLEKSQVPF